MECKAAGDSREEAAPTLAASTSDSSPVHMRGNVELRGSVSSASAAEQGEGVSSWRATDVESVR